MKGIVLAEKTRTSAQYFPALQKFVVLEIGLVLIPVTSREELSGLLIQMVSFLCVKYKKNTKNIRYPYIQFLSGVK